MVKNCLLAIALVLTSALQLFAQGPYTFEFIENKGQWEPEITFKGQLPAGDFYLHRNGFTIVQHNADDLLQLHANHSRETSTPSARQGTAPAEQVLRSHAYKVQFVGANTNPQIVPDKILSGYANYLIGNDPSKWKSGVKSCEAIIYKNIYPNIDARYYSESGRLKYDLIVHPGGRVSDIALRYDGADKLSVKNKELVIRTSTGTVKELYPYTYQFDNVNGKQERACSYKLDGNTVRFKVTDHTTTSTLVIDPAIVFSSFTGSTSDEWGFTATYGPDGSLFSGSIVFGNGFPTSAGAYKTRFSGGQGVDVGIFKFSANGARREYATYLGGTGNEFPHSLVADAYGNLVVMGRTYSGDFPGTLEGPGGLCDMFVSKLNASGTALIGSMRIGGQLNDGLNIEEQMGASGPNAHRSISLLRNYGDDSHSEVILDSAGYIYVAGQSQSIDFPMRGAGFQTKSAGKQDAVVLKIAPDCKSIIWSTYFGGADDDAAFVLALRPSNYDIYIAGGTSSPTLSGTGPIVANSVISKGLVGFIDGYVSVISNDGTTLRRTAFLGTTQSDIIYGIQFDKKDFPYVMGVSRGSWPVVNAAYSNPNTKQFVAKLSADLNTIVYSTTFGSGTIPNISPVAFLVDRCENVYVSGWGGWYQSGQDPYNLSGTSGMPVTSDALKSVTDDRDFYFIVLKRDAASLLYGSYFGQDGGLGEHVDGGTSRFDAQGVIYMAICANCGGGSSSPIRKDYPTTPGVWGPKNGTGSSGCNLGALKISFNFSGVAAGPKSFYNNAFDTVGCVPFTVEFRDTILNATSYEWDFGDGSDTALTASSVNHTFTAVGRYRVRLVATDPASCNVTDTAYITVVVRDDPANLDFNFKKLPPCLSLMYEFTNTSTFPPGKPFNPASFTWDFGDRTRVTPGVSPITHTFSSAGTYIGKLILHDDAYCNSPDSIWKELRISPLVKAQFETEEHGCAPYTAHFNNTSLGGQTFSWDFGDGNTSNDTYPVHTYNTVGTYTVKLIAIDSNTCNIIDSTTLDIQVHPIPVAAFSYSPVVPEVNKPIIFTNLSTGAVTYQWRFGDGDITLKNSPDTASHLYNATRAFNACLVALNEWGCADTSCQQVQALIDPLLDVPNAFTPGRFGPNSAIFVTGFGIAKMTWKIYNRWGTLVFETHNRRAGWDGTYKGQLQPMDVYAYTLEVEYFDGSRYRKTGDITLIR